MSFDSDGQASAGDERFGEQLGGGSVDEFVQHEGVVELGSGSDTSESDPDGGHSASEASEASESSADNASEESGAEEPPSPDGGGPDEFQEHNYENHLSYDGFDTSEHRQPEDSSDLFGLAAHAIAAQHELHNQSFGAMDHQPAEFDSAKPTDDSHEEYGASSTHSRSSTEHVRELPSTAEAEAVEPDVEEPESALQIEEIGSLSPNPTSKESLPNLEEVREAVRVESRSRIRSLEADIQRLEAAEWELRRRLNDAALQTEAARAEHERTTVSAAVHEAELQRLRGSMEQLRAHNEARIVELRTSADEQHVELEAQRRAHEVLRARFTEQSGALAEARAAVAELERTRIELETQTSNARRAEQRTQSQLTELREELDSTLSELANARAELTLQTQTLAEVRAQAREEALADFAPASSSEESMWRERYIELRRQMDAVATEFERREPEVLALQREHAEAEARASHAQDDKDQALSEKAAVERKLRAAERRASDLLLEQQLTEQLVADLRRQVLHLLTEKMLNTSGDSPLSPEDEEELVRLRDQVARNSPEQSGEFDGQTLISERLLLFRDVAELQLQNEALLKACRGLAHQLDPDGDVVASAAAATSQRSSADEIREAGDALEALEQRFVKTQAELEELRRSASSSEEIVKERNIELEAVRGQLHAAENQVADLRRRLAAPEPVAQKPVQDLDMLRLELQTERSRLGDTERQLNMTRDEITTLNKRVADGQLALTRAQQRIAAAESATAEARAEADGAQIALAALRSEKQLWAEREQRLMAQVSVAQAEADAHARSSGISQARQTELESKLIGTMERLETLVASSAGDARASELEEQVRVAESRSVDLQSRINELEDQAIKFQSEAERLQSKLQSTESDLAAAQKSASDLNSELVAVRSQHESEKANFQKRDDDLVEQVNNLEDSLTEVREKLRLLEETQGHERQSADMARKELDETREILEDTRRKFEVAEKELESARNSQADPKAPEAELLEAQKQRDINTRREIESSVRAELENSMRDEIESKVRSELTSSLRTEIEANLTPELETKVRKELESTLRPELEASIKSELSENSPALTNGSTDAIPSDLRSSNVSRSELEAEIRAQIAAEKPQRAMPEDVKSLFDALTERAPRDEVEQFQASVLAAEQERVKSAFRKRLDEVREAAEAEARAKVVEAEQRAEEKAAKRGEMKTKLQTQKLTKLEAKNKELEAQMEELRNKVRRLKGGATDSEPSELPTQVPKQQQSQQFMQQPFAMPSGFGNFPMASPFSPQLQSAPGSQLGFDQSQKRQNSFPDYENQKRRKEDDGQHANGADQS